MLSLPLHKKETMEVAGQFTYSNPVTTFLKSFFK